MRRDGSRFLGATFDVSPLYRFNAVQDWLAREGWSVATMLAHVRGLEEIFLAESRSPDVGRGTLARDRCCTAAAASLAFRTAGPARSWRGWPHRTIVADHRGDRLRNGFGIYHNQDDARRLARAIG